MEKRKNKFQSEYLPTEEEFTSADFQTILNLPKESFDALNLDALRLDKVKYKAFIYRIKNEGQVLNDSYKKKSPLEQMEIEVNKWNNSLGDNSYDYCEKCKHRGFVYYYIEKHDKYFMKTRRCECNPEQTEEEE